MDLSALKKIANEIRQCILLEVYEAQSGHPGGSLSAAEIFTSLYFAELRIDPGQPRMPDRDRFVLSKGHTAPGLYSALAYGLDRLRFICLWDGGNGDGAGGTAHMVEEVGRRTGRITWLDTRELW